MTATGHPLALSEIYGTEAAVLADQRLRYMRLIERFRQAFAEDPTYFFSAPGRTEIGGNHTDHNHGRVLAASVNLDAIAAVRENAAGKIRVFSEGYAAPFEVDLSSLESRQDEAGSTTALLRGIAARFVQLGHNVGGFDAQISSQVLPGSGLSSSAAIEVLLGTILNFLFNDGKIQPGEIAAIGQFAENTYFGKPCGLMDQMASAVGGVVQIDFAVPTNPQIKKMAVSLQDFGYSLLIVNTEGNHANLTPHYAAIPEEMKKVAAFFGKSVLRELTLTEVLAKLPALRNAVGDRAVLRALHFFEENERVLRQTKALEAGKMNVFLDEITASGNSSWKCLQNGAVPEMTHEQGTTLGLALTENFIGNLGEGACRVHGGGFAGTIQVFLPTNAVSAYRRFVEDVFGQGSVFELSLRPVGAVAVQPFVP